MEIVLAWIGGIALGLIGLWLLAVVVTVILLEIFWKGD